MCATLLPQGGPEGVARGHRSQTPLPTLNDHPAPQANGRLGVALARASRRWPDPHWPCLGVTARGPTPGLVAAQPRAPQAASRSPGAQAVLGSRDHDGSVSDTVSISEEYPLQQQQNMSGLRQTPKASSRILWSWARLSPGPENASWGLKVGT